jgi:hypothetical protein
MNKIIDKDFIIDEDNMVIEYIGKGGNVIIPEGVTDLLFNSFLEESITSLVIPGSIKEITSHVFSELINLKKVVINEGVEVIGFSAFYNCWQLEEIHLPKSLKQIDSLSFFGCSLLKTVYYNGNEKEYEEILKDAFFDEKINIIYK